MLRPIIALAAATFLTLALAPNEASARPGGGFHSGGFSGGAFRGGFAGSGFRGGFAGSGFRSGFAGPGFRSGFAGPGFRAGVVGPGFRAAGFAGPRWHGGWRHRGFVRRPFLFGVAAAGLYGAYDWGYPYYYANYGGYADDCLAPRRVWTPYGWRIRWVNVCY